MAEESDSAEATAADDPFAGGRQRIYDNVKWVLGVFGAIAAIIVAGSQTSKLGSLDPADTVELFGWHLPRVWLAIIGLIVALGSTAGCLLVAMRVLSIGHMTPEVLSNMPEPKFVAGAISKPSVGAGVKKRTRWLAETVADQYVVLPKGAENSSRVVSLSSARLDANEHMLTIFRQIVKRSDDSTTRRLCEIAHQPLPTKAPLTVRSGLDVSSWKLPAPTAGSPSPQRANVDLELSSNKLKGHVELPESSPVTPQPDSEFDSALLDAFNSVSNEFDSYDAQITLVLGAASYERVRLTAQRAVRYLVALAMVTAFGLGVFIWAANPPSSTALVANSAQPAVKVRVPTGRYDELHLLLGAKCDLTVPLSVRLLASGGGRILVQVADPPPANCSANGVFLLPETTQDK